MRSLLKALFFVVLLIPSIGFADFVFPQESDGWSFGVGFGVENDYDNASVIDFRTPTFGQAGSYKFSVVANIEIKDVGNSTETVYPGDSSF